MKKIALKFLAVALLLLPSISSGALGLHYMEVPFGQEISSSCTDALVCSHGYLWFGTENGLVRYEPYGTRKFFEGQKIYRLEEDSANVLWAFTSGGAAWFDREKGEFVPIMVKAENGDEKPCEAYCSTESEDGLFRLLGGNGVIYKLASGGNFASVEWGLGTQYKVEYLKLKSGGEYYTFNEKKGFGLFHSTSGKFELQEYPQIPFTAHLVDSEGTIWFSQYNSGLCRMSELGTVDKVYDMSDSDLHCNVVTSLSERGNELWIGTEGGGVSILNRKTGDMKTLVRKYQDYLSFPCDDIACVTPCGDAMLVVSRDNRIVLVKEFPVRTIPLGPVYSMTTGGSDEALCIEPDGSQGRFWVGTCCSGLFHVEIRPHSEGVQLHQEPGTEGRRFESIVGIPGGKILVSLAAEGLFVFDPASGRFSPFFFTDEKLDAHIKNQGLPVFLSKDNRGNILIMSDYIYVWNPSSGTVTRRTLINHANHECIRPVIGGGGIWFFCERYLYKWDASTMVIEPVYDVEEGGVNSVAADTDGFLWIGTDSGLFRFNPADKSLKAIETTLFKTVSSVMADGAGKVWVGAESSLFSYIVKQNCFVKLGLSDGVGKNRYCPGVVSFSGDGKILLGGAGGLQIINSNIAFDLDDIPEVSLDNMTLNGENVPITDRRLKLSSDFGALTITLLAKEKDMFREKMFRFTIKGPGGTKTFENPYSAWTLSGLSPGHYTVYGACTMRNGSWTKDEVLIELNIRQAFFKSLQFWITILLLVAWIIILFILYLRQKMKSDKEKTLFAIRRQEQSENRDFLLKISNELKAPLSLASGRLERIIRDREEGDPETDSLRSVFQQIGNTKSVINAVLDAHKIEIGTAGFFPTTVNLNNWVESVISNFDIETKERGITLVREYDPAAGNVNIDADKLENVLFSMLHQILKLSKDDSEVKVCTFVLEGQEMVRVAITSLTAPAKNDNTYSYLDTIVQLHGGRIGSRFFDLPAGKTAIKEKKSKKDIAHASVLVVDDEAMMREYLFSEIGERAAAVHAESNGVKALDFLRKRKVDVVVTDVMMPEMDGFELVAAIRKIPELMDVAIVILSARAESKSKEIGLSAGADAYISKPFSTDALIETINKVLGKD